ncbi:L-ribulose-5-phosphate 4-epimerase [Tuwongella immobilis]|uniref:L-ribulose-5-phosphate 4-epimerase n=1 Tax=Tuwongella immobilis TaxID=692036 RepID=A0A6C2YQN7_9BACT|nr:L-ribulose-5-phosphate 4-epimerase [Tuwongella immobilis]VIP03796.1 Class II aldolase/adducin family protein OS=Fimbriimonas ginsengisoli Gsoil 348 GN=OP10G_4172 PE=4 SV=1: Aldolase_II [Tuwongella immobilis]VTS04959.1 Class II aldolase/adducin family protein OS=Fimbriimonas ginsengisoli Gsoil 348 GN=OP10G_4172 PE=4 SV=1: Aldolase_II [Tuwongella immobilis]
MRDTRLSDLREQVCWLNRALPQHGLVVMHSGNASGYDRRSGRLVIKPSGMDYSQITPPDLVEVDVDSGCVIDGHLRPSVDLPHHLYLYRHFRDVEFIIHTHSNYATAFAACHRPIPLVLTAIADEFGGEVPCAPYVSNEGDAIGRAIVAHRTQAPAILLANHGVFAWGNSAPAALKAATMVEDVAKTVWLALQIGQPAAIPESEARKWYDRYQHNYGQSTNAPPKNRAA